MIINPVNIRAVPGEQVDIGDLYIPLSDFFDAVEGVIWPKPES